jgi:hypothetical protein
MWGTNWPCPRWATTTPCPRKAKAAPGAHRQRGGADFQRLPPPPGGDAARAAATPAHRRATAAATSSARCTAGPTAPTGSCWAPRTSQQDPCLNLRNYKLHPSWNGLLFEDNGRDIAADLAGMGPSADLDFTGYVLDRVETARVQLQLEDLHRGLSGGLPRRPLPPRPGQLRHLRRPALGVQGR